MKPGSQPETGERQQRSHFLPLLGQLLFVVPDPAHVDHQSRVDHDPHHADRTTEWQLPGLATEGMSHAAHSAVNRCSPVVACYSMAQGCNLHLATTHVESPPCTTFQTPSWTPLGKADALHQSNLCCQFVVIRDTSASPKVTQNLVA